MGLHYKIISSINSISLLCQVWLLGTPWTGTYQVPHPWISPGKNTGAGYHSLLKVISLTQGSNPGLLHCRKILYHPIHQGSPQLSIFLKFFIIKCCGEIWAVVISEYQNIKWHQHFFCSERKEISFREKGSWAPTQLGDTAATLHSAWLNTSALGKGLLMPLPEALSPSWALVWEKGAVTAYFAGLIS